MADCIHDIEEEWCGTCNPRLILSPLEGWVNTVSAYIPVEDPMPLDELVSWTGLERHQVDQAVAAIRERHPDMPLVSDRNGIRFTTDADAVAAFRATAARTALTIMRRRFRGAVLPYLKLGGETRQTRLVEARLAVVLDDIEQLIGS